MRIRRGGESQTTSRRRGGVASILSTATLLFSIAASNAEATTRFVADTGVDAAGCGLTSATACRSITQAIANAVDGDTISVAPGRYGDLNRNGILGEAGEENGSPACSCVLLIDKAVIVISSAGAAVTTIDGRSANVIRNVMITDDGAQLGKPGKGFTVTTTAYEPFPEVNASDGIVIAANSVMVRGNQVLYSDVKLRSGRGIHTGNQLHSILIEGNLAVGWEIGIDGGAGVIVRKNQVMDNNRGIVADGGTVTGNVAVDNVDGFRVTGAAVVTGNAAYANLDVGFEVTTPFVGLFTKNNMFGNRCGLDYDSLSVALDATNNYWGGPAGPGVGPSDSLCESGATTDTTPFATKPFAVKVLKP